MDILNFISWIRGKRQVTSVDPAKTLIPVGLKDGRRDDEYLAGAISVEDLSSQIGGITVNGYSPINSLNINGNIGITTQTFINGQTADINLNVTPSVNIYNSNGTLTGNRAINANSFSLAFNGLGSYTAFTSSTYYFETTSASQRSSIGTTLQSATIENYHFFDNTRSFIIAQKNYIGLASRNATVNNGVFAKLDFNTNKIFTTNDLTNYSSNIPVGLNIEFGSRVYELGQINGFNTAKLSIKDQATYPLQVSGTNMSANTAGADSGQFLKINVNGVDYKINLLNP